MIIIQSQVSNARLNQDSQSFPLTCILNKGIEDQSCPTKKPWLGTRPSNLILAELILLIL